MKISVKKFAPVFRVIRWMVDVCYPEIEVVGRDKLPDEPVVFVGNHSQMHGPIACELYFPESCYTWCAGQMMHVKEVPVYAFKDFWAQKPRQSRWFFKILSYIIAPLSAVIFNNARTIPVYQDNRILTTFKATVARLQEGKSVVIFPEHDVKHNNIIYDFQDKFIDIAKPYFKRTGRELLFVPLYIAPNLKRMFIGEPIRFCVNAPINEERRRICDYLMMKITELAVSLPEHTVVPYRNIPKKDYPLNTSGEVAKSASTKG